MLPSLPWRHKEHDGVSNRQHLEYLLNRLFRPKSKKTLKLRVTGLYEGNSPVTSEFPAQRASNADLLLNSSKFWILPPPPPPKKKKKKNGPMKSIPRFGIPRFGSDNGLAPNSLHVLIWINDGLGFWRIYASPGLKREMLHIRITILSITVTP